MKKDRRSTMLECWRPPTGAGDPLGCIATTFTFDSGFFEEECLSRFLNIDSHPDREGLAYLIERENKLGELYAGVLIDHQQAGVDHSLRWDVLPVRIPGCCQHAKIAVLVWSDYIRVVVSSANLTPCGYRSNQEVVGFIDFSPEAADHEQLAKCCLFLGHLLEYVPSPNEEDTVLQRARQFVDMIQAQAKEWEPENQRKNRFKPILIFNIPEPTKAGTDVMEQLNGGKALDGCLDTCIRFGGAPSSVKVASPFFNQYDKNGERDVVTAQLCKRMARGVERSLTFCLPNLNHEKDAHPRLAAPKALYDAGIKQVDRLLIHTLPHTDEANNFRPWHAKMIWLENDRYAILMIGSSNFTSPAMGLNKTNNAEANLIYMTPQKAYAKHIGLLAQCWPQTKPIQDMDSIEWTGTHYPLGETDVEDSAALPEGFIAARFQAGDNPEVHLFFKPEKLPKEWQIYSGQRYTELVVDHATYSRQKEPQLVKIPWKRFETPGKLLVQWMDKKAFWPVNVENEYDLPIAQEIHAMSVHDLICILSAYDYSMAIRAWAKRQKGEELDGDLDDAIPPELDPLKRFRIQETFLHRIRTRARMLAGIRHQLQRPAWTEKALQWRLEGIIGIKSLADKLIAAMTSNGNSTTEAVLELSDFFIMLSEVQYQPAAGALQKTQFEKIYHSFLRRLLELANIEVEIAKKPLPKEVHLFWKRTYDRCLP